MLHARGLRTGERMAADEAPILAREAGQQALGRADIGHDAVRGAVVEREPYRLRERRDGSRDEHGLGTRDRARDVGGRGVDRSQRERLRAYALVGVVAAHLRACAPPRREADRAPDQPQPQDRHLRGMLLRLGRPPGPGRGPALHQTALSALPANSAVRWTAAANSSKLLATSACGPSQTAWSG